MANHFFHIVYLPSTVMVIDFVECLLGPERYHVIKQATVNVHCNIGQVRSGVDVSVCSSLINGLD